MIYYGNDQIASVIEGWLWVRFATALTTVWTKTMCFIGAFLAKNNLGIYKFSSGGSISTHLSYNEWLNT